MAIDKPIVIVGCGPGSAEYLTPAAVAAAGRAEVLVGAPRLLELFPDSSAARVPVDARIEPLLETLTRLVSERRGRDARDTGRRVAVLVSGDPGCFSLAGNIVRRFGRDRCQIIPAVSSVQLAFARLGLESVGAHILSAHGRVPAVSPDQLQQSDRIAILAGTGEALAWAGQIAVALNDTHECYLCENLSLPAERIERLAAAELATRQASSLSIVLLIDKGLTT